MPAWVIPGEEIQDIDDRHRIPAHRPTPKIGRTPRLMICPWLLFALIPSVIQQSGFRISRMPCDENKLIDDVVKRVRFFEALRVPCIKRFCHEQTIQPHLKRIHPLVPESAFVSSGLVFQLTLIEKAAKIDKIQAMKMSPSANGTV